MKIKNNTGWMVVEHTFNREAEAGGAQSLRPA